MAHNWWHDSNPAKFGAKIDSGKYRVLIVSYKSENIFYSIIFLFIIVNMDNIFNIDFLFIFISFLSRDMINSACLLKLFICIRSSVLNHILRTTFNHVSLFKVDAITSFSERHPDKTLNLPVINYYFSVLTQIYFFVFLRPLFQNTDLFAQIITDAGVEQAFLHQFTFETI